MKREFVALSLLAIILTLTIINTYYVENKTETLTEDIETAEKLYLDGDKEGAAESVEVSFNNWQGWDSYAHILLRHTEVDLVTDAYFELLSQLESEEKVSEASFSKLKEQLNSISRMEQIKVGSIF